MFVVFTPGRRPPPALPAARGDMSSARASRILPSIAGGCPGAPRDRTRARPRGIAQTPRPPSSSSRHRRAASLDPDVASTSARTEVFVACVPLVGLEAVGAALGDAYPAPLEHTMVLVRHPGDPVATAYDFLLRPHQPRHRRVALARRFRTRRVSRPTTSRRSLPKMLARRLRRHRNPERHRRRRRIVSNRVRRQVTSRRKQLQRTHSRVGRGARRETRPPRRGFRGPMGGGGVKEVRATRTTWTAASSSSIRRIILGRATARTLATGDLRAPSNARHGAGGVPTV